LSWVVGGLASRWDGSAAQEPLFLDEFAEAANAINGGA
jgi:hypothetical protein